MLAVSATLAAVILAALGVFSALLSFFVLEQYQLFVFRSVPLLPAILFGAVLAFAIYAWGTKNPLAVLSGFLTSVVSWCVAGTIFYVGIFSIPSEKFSVPIPGLVGFVAGAVGAAITAAGIALVAPSYRRLTSLGWTVLVGALSGSLAYDGTAAWVLLVPVVWQASVAATIGYGMANPKEQQATLAERA